MRSACSQLMGRAMNNHSSRLVLFVGNNHRAKKTT